MFDNVNPSAPAAPQQPIVPPAPSAPQPPTPPTAAAPQPLTDMFAGLDAGLGSPVPPMGVNPAQPGGAATGMNPEPSGGSRKYFIVGFLVLLLIGIVVGGYFAYGKFSAMVNKDGEQPGTVETPVETAKPDTTTPATTTKPAVETADTASGTTGSSTATSTATTTSPLSADTATTSPSATSTAAAPAADRTKDSDNDGLTDYEEVNFYKSNPAVGDTDGDGFLDGAEVKNGFNPLGAGKMIDSQIKPSVTQ
jgi:hypothetical protein